jgi:probable FeS assembly SUF system protein SufT
VFDQEYIELRRDCEATLIPSGTSVTLQKGALVVITQALGNSYTVYAGGNLVRVAGCDGDALNRIILEEIDAATLPGTTEDKIWYLLKTCFDPEIPVNVVDLGLIYACEVMPIKSADHIDTLKKAVFIRLTLTAPACGMGPVLVADIEQKVKSIPEVETVTIDLVFDPPWDRDKMSEAAKLQLGLL